MGTEVMGIEIKWIIGGIILVIVYVKMFGNKAKGASRLYPYERIDKVFSKAELHFYNVLCRAVPGEYVVLGKVRIADVLKTNLRGDRRSWQIAFNKISSKHFDFVLCNKEDMKIVAAVELDDKSHSTTSAMKRDKFVNGACDSAKLPLIRFPAKQRYIVSEINAKVSDALELPEKK